MPKKQAAQPESAVESLSFEAALAELEQIVSHLEQGDLTLEESLKLYERGQALVAWCARQLDEAELKVQVLSHGAAEA